MAQMGRLWCPRQGSSDSSRPDSPRGVTATAVGHHRGTAGCAGIGRRLMRKLRKQGKVLCSATRPATFRCQYDPLSYALNFDADGFGDDAYHFAFSSRFASGAATSTFKCPPAAGLEVAAGATHHHLAVSASL